MTAIDPSRLATRTLSPKQIVSVVRAGQTPQIALWDGAVSSGKTFASLLALLLGVAEAPDTGLIVIVGKTLQTIERNVITPLQDPASFGRAMSAQVHHTAGSNTATILGRKVWLVGANDVRAEDRIRGATVALAYVDEATLVPHSFWMMLLSRLRVPGAKLYATTNPDGPAHWMMKDFIRRGLEVGLVRFQFRLEDNPTLEPTYVERLRNQYTGLWYRRFILGEWCLAEGACFDMWDPDRHVVRQLPAIRRWIALGIDYGTTNPFAALALGLGADNVLYLGHEWRWDSKQQHRQLTDAQYSERLRAWLKTIGVHPQWTIVDPSAASFVTQLHQDGLTPAAGDNAVLDGIRTVASLLGRDRLKVHASCTGFINEIPGYSWDPDKAAKGEDAPIKADDHSLDAARYAVHTTQSAWRSDLREAA
ncbi:PBSX family phage terminase large subunit [Actinomadura luteofluorescens]|uniref:PBSX family phage terminase large subunit n=1 Tax=Actinomadura luteofluorescens TaxID=46163 RepID=UPI00346E245B